jgi:hypothetical protein
MSSPSDDDPEDPEDILRVIQAKIDRENVQTPGAVPTTDVFSAGDENEIPSAARPALCRVRRGLGSHREPSLARYRCVHPRH